MEKMRFFTTGQISERIAETPEGFWIISDVPIARTGDQLYKANEVRGITPNKDGLVLVKRYPEEVFSEKSIASWEGKPFTIDHPTTLITPEIWGEYAKGHITNVKRGSGDDSDLLIGDLVVTDQRAIELIKGGIRQISGGYDAEYEEIEPGVAVQKDIIGNHVALVIKGRAGNRCVIKDSCEGLGCIHCGQCKKTIKEGKMSKFTSKLMNRLRLVVRDKDFDGRSDDEKAEMLAEAVEAEAVEDPNKVVNTDQETVTLESVNQKVDSLAKNVELVLKVMGEILEVDKQLLSEPFDQEGVEKEQKIASLKELLEKYKTEGNEEEANKVKEELSGLGVTVDQGIEENLDDKDKDQDITKDFDSLWSGVIAKAEILHPGIKIEKPTRNHKLVVEKVKREALRGAYTRDTDYITPIIGNRKVDELKGDVLDIAFLNAAEAIKRKNNTVQFTMDIAEGSKKLSNQLVDLNRKHKEYWSKQKSH